jgi:hypothetical protein
MPRQAVAFLSYVREADQKGDVTRFREALEVEVRARGWEDFEIFQDRQNIGWGDDWRERVMSSLGKMMMLIPIITPGLFRSDACQFEIDAFCEREKRLPGDRRLILPVYFIDTREFENAGASPDPRVNRIKKSTYLDFRQFRLIDADDERYREAIARAGERVATLLEADEARNREAAANGNRAGPGVQESPALPFVAEPPKVGAPEEKTADRTPTDSSVDHPPPRPRAYVLAGLGVVLLVAAGAYYFFGPHIAVEPSFVVEELKRTCVVRRSQQAYRTPSEGGPLGPILAIDRAVDVDGRVAGTSWLRAGPTEPGGPFYFPADVCAS